MVICNLQILDIITALEKPEPIRLSLQNHILTSADESFTDSEDSDSDNPSPPKGDKVTRSFFPHGVSSKAQITYMTSSINHLGAHIIDLDAVVKHIADNFKDHSTAICASISSLQESQTALSQRLTALEVNQASILKNQYVIMNLLCEVSSTSGINTNDVPKGKKKKREDIERKREDTERGSEQAKMI